MADAEDKYAEAIEMYRTTDLSLTEISRRCGISRSGLAVFIQRRHRDLMYQRHGIGGDGTGKKLRRQKGQSSATHTKYRDAVLACDSSEYIDMNLSRIARKFGVSPSGLANQLRMHYPEILQRREAGKEQLGIVQKTPAGVRPVSTDMYSAAVELLRNEDVTIKEAAARCGVSFSGLRQHIYFYHKDMVETREKRRREGQANPKIGKVSGNGQIRESDADKDRVYAHAVELFRDTSLPLSEIAKAVDVDVNQLRYYIRMWHRKTLFTRYGVDSQGMGNDREKMTEHKLYRKSTREKYAEAIDYLRKSGESTESVAKRYGFTPEVFRHYLKEHFPELYAERGMETLGNGRKVLRRSSERYAEAIREYRESGGTLRSIATRLDLPYSSLYSFVKRNHPELLGGT